MGKRDRFYSSICSQHVLTPFTRMENWTFIQSLMQEGTVDLPGDTSTKKGGSVSLFHQEMSV